MNGCCWFKQAYYQKSKHLIGYDFLKSKMRLENSSDWKVGEIKSIIPKILLNCFQCYFFRIEIKADWLIHKMWAKFSSAILALCPHKNW